MSESLAVGGAVASPDANARVQSALLDPRRKLQLGLGVFWLLDGVLQLQPFMFGKGFPQMLAGNAPGNPAFVASPITWSAGFIDHHLGIFAAVMVTVAVYCSGRLAVYCSGRLVVARRSRRPTELDTDGGHIAMGLAMAGMLVERLRVLPAGAWEAVFAAGAVWFGWRVLQVRRGATSTPWRCLHPMPHLVECERAVLLPRG